MSSHQTKSRGLAAEEADQPVGRIGPDMGVPDTEVEVRRTDDGVDVWAVADFSEVQTFEDAIRLAQNLYGEIIPSYELGDGFVRLEDKDLLVGVTFAIIGWGLSWSAYGEVERYSVIRVITEDGRKFRFSDGSTGLHKQLTMRFRGDPANFAAIVALGGLRRSEYTPRAEDGGPKLDGNGRPILKAVTYYLDTETLTVASVK